MLLQSQTSLGFLGILSLDLAVLKTLVPKTVLSVSAMESGLDLKVEEVVVFAILTRSDGNELGTDRREIGGECDELLALC